MCYIKPSQGLPGNTVAEIMEELGMEKFLQARDQVQTKSNVDGLPAEWQASAALAEQVEREWLLEQSYG